MPNLDSSLHLDMLSGAQQQQCFPKRLLQAIRLLQSPPIYGLQWGDPDFVAPLRFIKERYVSRYVNPAHNSVEIGPGGGRWTRYLSGFKTIYAVDYHQPLLEELKRNFGKQRNIRFIKNNGTDFPGIPEKSIDYLFSFGTFVHLDFNQIEGYLTSIKPIMAPEANVVIQYSDKTKIMGQLSDSFSYNTPEKMRGAVMAGGYRILEEDTTTLWHSSVIRFTI
jgi:hypothetical protein